MRPRCIMPSESPAPYLKAPAHHSGRQAVHAEANARLLQRLKSVEGHVRGIQKMVSEDAYCIDAECIDLNCIYCFILLDALTEDLGTQALRPRVKLMKSDGHNVVA